MSPPLSQRSFYSHCKCQFFLCANCKFDLKSWAFERDLCCSKQLWSRTWPKVLSQNDQEGVRTQSCLLNTETYDYLKQTRPRGKGKNCKSRAGPQNGKWKHWTPTGNGAPGLKESFIKANFALFIWPGYVLFVFFSLCFYPLDGYVGSTSQHSCLIAFRTDDWLEPKAPD